MKIQNENQNSGSTKNRNSFRFITIIIFFLCTFIISITAQELNPSKKSFPGTIRAEGVFGLFGVDGILCFHDDLLIWQVKDSKDIGQYHTEKTGDGIRFEAKVALENGEEVLWTGIYNGETINEVKAIWTRKEGDFVHDLLLPEVLTLVFTPDQAQEMSCQ